MKREIKFRAWDKIGKQGMLGWNRMIEIGVELFFKNNFGFEPLQYTGLHDRLGKEIYEGDLVKVKGYGEKPLEYFGVIEWWKETAMFGISHYKVINYYGMVLDDCWKGGLRFEDIKIETTEIIGNIYEKEAKRKE